MKKYILFLIIAAMISLIGCNFSKETYNTRERLTEQSNNNTGIDNDLKYEDFVEYVEKFREEFRASNFISAVADGPLPKQIVVFPKDTKLDSRNNDGIDGDTARPTKYILYYLTQDKTALVKLSFVYTKAENSGIVLQSIVSPADNIGIEEKYQSLKRPYSITKILSRNNYLMVFEYFLVDPDKIEASDDEKIMKLINIEIDFYKSVEAFLIEQDKNNQ